MAKVFISLCFGEAMKEAKVLKAALEARGISAFLCAVPEGDSIASAVADAIDACRLVVVMGTQTYGKDTGIGFSTFQELQFIIDEKKPMFLVKMCERFELSLTRLRLGGDICYAPWAVGAALPAGLVDRVIQKLDGTAAPVVIAPARRAAGGGAHGGQGEGGQRAGTTVGTLEFGNGKYTGEISDGKQNGRGTCYYTNAPNAGDRYEGEYKDGKQNGRGTHYYANAPDQGQPGLWDSGAFVRWL
jgi:hypothetical protein